MNKILILVTLKHWLMKRISYLLSILFLLVLTVFTSCKDDEQSESEADRKTRQLTSGAFTVDEVTLADNEEYTVDGTVSIRFNSNTEFTVSGNAALPTPSGADAFPASGNWAFTDTQNFNTIALTSGGNTINLSIVTLDDNNFDFRYAAAEPKPTDNVQATVRSSR